MKEIQHLEEKIALLQAELDQVREENVRLINDSEKTRTRSSLSSDEHLQCRQLWSGIRHEILTPMDAILGLTELVLEDDELKEEQRESLELINASADRLFSVLSDIIDYSDIQEGNLRSDTVNFNLAQELEYDLYIADFAAKHCGLSFSSSFDKTIPAYLYGDPSRMRQVLNCLLNNALAKSSEGEVSLHVSPAGYDQNGYYLLRFSVEDTSSPQKEDQARLIFTNSFDATRKYSEDDLSLIVAAKMVSFVGGELGFALNEKAGSSFWFTWPCKNSEAMHMGELPADFQQNSGDIAKIVRGKKILLAEDEFINATVAKAFLEQVGLEVEVVANGKKAIQAFTKQKFDAVLMDVQMPEVDGLEATKILRKKERELNQHCPIIALTAHAMQGDKERCLQAGMDDYLPKPLDKDQLLSMVANYLTKRGLLLGHDPECQQKIMKILFEKGWHLTFAESGKTAMYEVSLRSFDMIIVDPSLSGEDGCAALDTIRKLEKFSAKKAYIIGFGINEDMYRNCALDAYYPLQTAFDQLTKAIADL